MQIGLEIPFLPELDDRRKILLQLLLEAHAAAAEENNNASKAAFNLSVSTSGSYRQAVSSALMSVGYRHAPLAEARTNWGTLSTSEIKARLKAGQIIAGWGNSFHKTAIDPAFEELDKDLEMYWPAEWKWKRVLTGAFHEYGKRVYPNAALYTAIVCDIIGYPKGLEEMLFILARLPVWTQQLVPKPDTLKDR